MEPDCGRCHRQAGEGARGQGGHRPGGRHSGRRGRGSVRQCGGRRVAHRQVGPAVPARPVRQGGVR